MKRSLFGIKFGTETDAKSQINAAFNNIKENNIKEKRNTQYRMKISPSTKYERMEIPKELLNQT